MAELGSAAPDFSLTGATNQDDTEVTLGDFEGKKLVILFYPLDFSPVCSEQVPDFNDNLDAIRARGADVIAINRDSTFAHKAWSESLGGIGFPLLSDMNLEVSKKYGMALDEVGITTRGVFIVDGSGKIAFKHIEDAPPDNTLTAEQVLDELDNL